MKTLGTFLGLIATAIQSKSCDSDSYVKIGRNVSASDANDKIRGSITNTETRPLERIPATFVLATERSIHTVA